MLDILNLVSRVFMSLNMVANIGNPYNCSDYTTNMF